MNRPAVVAFEHSDLAVKRQVVDVFGHNNLSQQAGTGNTFWDYLLRNRRDYDDGLVVRLIRFGTDVFRADGFDDFQHSLNIFNLAGNFLADTSHTACILIRFNDYAAYGQRRATKMLLAFFTLVGNFLFLNFHCTSVRALLKKLHLFWRGRRCKAFTFGSKDQTTQLIQLVFECINLSNCRIIFRLRNSRFHMPQKYEKCWLFTQPFDTFFDV
jgi:hypothetical protein